MSRNAKYISQLLVLLLHVLYNTRIVTMQTCNELGKWFFPRVHLDEANVRQVFIHHSHLTVNDQVSKSVSYDSNLQ